MASAGREGRHSFISAKQLAWKLSDRLRQAQQARTLSPEAALGRRGEDVAHRYLRSAGYLVLGRNYRPSGGEAEVDIVARDRDKLVFIEVKSRLTAEFGDPERAIGSEKQRNITRAARAYATRAGISWNQVRFDIVSVVFTDPPSVSHFKDAFFEGRARDGEMELR